MNIYKHTENASLNIVLSEHVTVNDVLFRCDEIVSAGFKLVTLISSSAPSPETVVTFHRIMFQLQEKGTAVFLRIPFSAEGSLEVSQQTHSIVCYGLGIRDLTVDLLERHSRCFFVCSARIDDLDYTVSLLSAGWNRRIILDPTICYTNLDEYGAFFQPLFQMLQGVELLLEPEILPMALIRTHPCNVYLCSGCDCHGGHGNMIRHLTVDGKGDIYLYRYFFLPPIGNIFQGSLPSILQQFPGSKTHGKFIAANKKLFGDVVDKYYLSTIPWFEYLEGYLADD